MAENWTIQRLLAWTTQYFSGKGIPDARLEAELLLAHVLDRDRVGLYIDYYQPVNGQERAAYRELIQRRVKGEPVAYLTGKKDFYSLTFKVNRSVLIPRPDTEVLVDRALELARVMGGSLCIADVGTGCGAIAVTLAVHLPESRIYAIDISVEALEVAKENAITHGVTGQVVFLAGDILEPLGTPAGELDMVVANLPYIPTREWESLDPGIRDYEPRKALDGGKDGMEHYRRLLPQAGQRLRRGGYLLVEIGHDQATAMVSLLKGFAGVEVAQDWGGRDRVVIARKEGNTPEDIVLPD